MKQLKLLPVAVALIFSSAIFANPDSAEKNKRSASHEISKLLKHSFLTAEEEFTTTVRFRLTEDLRIHVYSVNSENEEVVEFLKERLEGQVMRQKSWVANKLYELPVKVEKK